MKGDTGATPRHPLPQACMEPNTSHLSSSHRKEGAGGRLPRAFAQAQNRCPRTGLAHPASRVGTAVMEQPTGHPAAARILFALHCP